MSTDVRRRTHALVYIGGGPCTPVDPMPPNDEVVVIAADSGCDLALSHGRHVDVVVGDMDSVSAEALSVARHGGAVVEVHTCDKDFTDFELALERASEIGAAWVTVLGGTGGRLDHMYFNVAVLASKRWQHLDVRARFGDTDVIVIHGPGDRTVRGLPGATISLAAMHGPASGVTTDGLAFGLRDDVLHPDVARSCSNTFVTATASVHVTSGTVVVFVPDRDQQTMETT